MEYKNTVNEINGILNAAEEKINEFKAQQLNLSKRKHTEKKNPKKKKNRQSMNELWDSFKEPNTYVTGVPKGGTQKILEELMVEKFSTKIPIFNEKQKSTNLRRSMNSQAQETYGKLHQGILLPHCSTSVIKKKS